ncbi:hypothetical protein ElyMa_004661600 [Elysia marginata]|uniref:Uncharacterized protein n=1 Tax=Elysia marginata TaxID=1093978 RepID=A0AAV4I688_9GAST|nr:hypothetical protein ElyMa_004661600 [Elysia marginata]
MYLRFVPIRGHFAYLVIRGVEKDERHQYHQQLHGIIMNTIITTITITVVITSAAETAEYYHSVSFHLHLSEKIEDESD